MRVPYSDRCMHLAWGWRVGSVDCAGRLRRTWEQAGVQGNQPRTQAGGVTVKPLCVASCQQLPDRFHAHTFHKPGTCNLTCPYACSRLPTQAAVGVVQKGLRPAMPANTPPALAIVMEACWAQEPTQRPTFR